MKTFIVCVVMVPAVASAQKLGWSGTAEASGNVLFGNARDRLAAARLQIGRADSTLEVRADSRFTMPNRPTTRAIRSGRVERRYATGAGAKYTIHHSKENESSVSLALLDERTQPRNDEPGAAADTTTRWLSRWSLRVRAKQQLTRTVKFTHLTFYQPTVERASKYTVNSTTTLATTVTSKLSLTLTCHDNYDSESRGRGARSNNDGQLLFGLSPSF